MRAVFACLALMILSACGGGANDLGRNVPNPDEFGVLPAKPLQMPDNFQILPTPGGVNRVAVNPKADAVVALGGRAEALIPQGSRANEADILAAATRYGMADDIRAILRAEGQGGAGFSFSGSSYFAQYAAYRLDAYAELERLRALGIKTPTAPPQ